MRRSLILVLVLSVTAAAGCKRKEAGEAELPPPSGPGAAPRPALPSVDQVEKPAAASSGDTTGTTYPIARAEVAPTMSGVISTIPVIEGSQVKKGDVLFRLRTTDMTLRVRQAQTAEQAALVELTAATEEHDRMKRLLDKNAIDRAQYDHVKAHLDAAQAGLDSAKVGVQLAQQALGDASVRSPIDGVVTHKLKNEGEMATMMPPTVVVVVEDHRTLELRFKLPETQLGAIAVGDEVKAHFASVDVDRPARITRLSPDVDPLTRTIEVISEIDNRDGALKAGMLADVILPHRATSSTSPHPAAGAEAASPAAEAANAAKAAPAERTP